MASAATSTASSRCSSACRVMPRPSSSTRRPGSPVKGCSRSTNATSWRRGRATYHTTATRSVGSTPSSRRSASCSPMRSRACSIATPLWRRASAGNRRSNPHRRACPRRFVASSNAHRKRRPCSLRTHRCTRLAFARSRRGCSSGTMSSQRASKRRTWPTPMRWSTRSSSSRPGRHPCPSPEIAKQW